MGRSSGDCGEVARRVYEYLDGELDAATIGRIRIHLQECGACVDEVAIDRAIQALVRRCCVCQSAPEQLRSQILARITTVTVQSGGQRTTVQTTRYQSGL